MGFASARPLDACLGDREKIRAVLDDALFKKTQVILHTPANKNIPTHIKLKKAAAKKARDQLGKRQGYIDKVSG